MRSPREWSRRDALTLAAGAPALGAVGACDTDRPLVAEPVVDWNDHPWAYASNTGVPRRHNPRRLPLHAPEFSAAWSDEYRSAMLVAGPTTPHNALPLLRRWLTGAWLDLPTWCQHPRLLDLLESAADTPGPAHLDALADWYPSPDVPSPWSDLTEWTTQRLLDGFSVQPLQVSPDGSTVVLAIDWDDVPLPGPYVLPNVAVWWTRQARGWRIDRIELAERRPEARRKRSVLPSDLRTRLVRPGDGPAWQHALFVARCANLVAGQTDTHLARCHLWVESAALMLAVHGDAPALQRVRTVLAPFLRDVTGINRLGDALILGRGGLLPRSSGLGVAGLNARLQQRLAGMDWRGFAPRGPEHPVLGNRWRFGPAAHAFWNAIGRFVDEAFSTTSPGEVEALAYAVRAHNAEPTTPQRVHRSPLPGMRWAWPTEMAAAARGNGHWSVPTTLDDVRQLCRVLVFHATFLHSWTNDEGWIDGGSLRHAAFGLRHLTPPPMWGPGWWRSTLPTLDDAIPQIAVGWVLHRSRWGCLGEPDHPAASETLDKADELPMIRRLVHHLTTPGPDGVRPSDTLTAAGLPPVSRWRVRINT